MSMSRRLHTLGLSFLLSISFPYLSTGQGSVWNSAQNLKEGAGKKVGKTTSTLKKWKDHLQHWGLDTNYNHALSLAGKLNTNGWSVGLIYQKPLGTYYERKRGKYAGKSQFYQLNFSEVKHEKQVKQKKENTAFPELGASQPILYNL